jgi:predicted ATPase
MMRRLKIENFKCFSHQSIPLNRLTVLCGPNAGGKSTVIQALLLHHMARELDSGDILVNGPFGLRLGDADGLLCRSQDEHRISEKIRIDISDLDGEQTDWAEFSIPDGSPRRLHIEARSQSVRISQGPKEPFQFTYLSAERVGPRLVQEEYSDNAGGFETVGYAGQFTAEILANRERQKLRSDLQTDVNGKESASSQLLLHAVQGWMSKLFGAMEIQTRTNGNAPPSIYFLRPGIAEDWTIASNTGFGLSYALPIIVAGLLAPAGGTLIVDSPEAHLHPAAQTAIAKFLCWVASADVNVILETHSDYVLDGVRIALTDSTHDGLDRSECSFLSFSIDESGRRQLAEVTIGENGKPSSWPMGFFDQQVENLRAITENVRSRS